MRLDPIRQHRSGIATEIRARPRCSNSLVVRARPTTGAIRCCRPGLIRSRPRRGRTGGGFRGVAEPPPCSAAAVAIRHVGKDRTTPPCWRRTTRHCAQILLVRRAGFEPACRSGGGCSSRCVCQFRHRRTCSHPRGEGSGTRLLKTMFGRQCPPGAGRSGRHRQTKSPGRSSRNPGFLGKPFVGFA